MDAEADIVDGDEIAEAHGQVLGLDGDVAVAVMPRREHDRAVVAPPLFRQQRDEGGFERGGPVWASRSGTVPVASTRPASIATSQSKRAASSI